MIIRIVRMTFAADKTADFLKIFDASKHKIRSFPGCRHLELWRDADFPEIFTTYSHWDNVAGLENYRQSELFKSTWAKTKVLFTQKPVAWSNTLVEAVE